MKVIKLVLVRHGESQWNKESKFTGWHDIDLTNKGHLEAKRAGYFLKKSGFVFDCAYTSVLKRAIYTLWDILSYINQPWIYIEKTWFLNERHYGKLQGLSKLETIEKYGNEQVQLWRRDFNIIPPKLTLDDPQYPGKDIRYINLDIKDIPLSESLYMTSKRVIKYWEENIQPKFINNKKIIIVAHGNSLRVLLKYLVKMSENEIFNFNIPTAIPIVCEFYSNMQFIKYYYLNNTSM